MPGDNWGKDHLKLHEQLWRIRQHDQNNVDPTTNRQLIAEAERDEAYTAIAMSLVVGIASVILVGFGFVGTVGLVCTLLFPLAIYMHLKRKKAAQERREKQFEQFQLEKHGRWRRGSKK